MVSFGSAGKDARRRVRQLLDPGLAIGVAIVAAAFLGIGLLVAREIVYHSDDAYILYAYAVNLAETGVISYYPGGPPTEGATDFLFMVVLAGLVRLGMSVEMASVAVSAVAAGGSFAVLYTLALEAIGGGGRGVRLVLGAATATLLLGTTYLVAAMFGFGVFFFLAPLSLMLLCFLRGNDAGFYLSALATCLARPDGFVFAAPLTLVVLWRSRRSARSWLLFAGTLLLPGLLYFAWRYSYFGMLFPLPFYVKTVEQAALFGLFHLESLEHNIRALLQPPLLVLFAAALFLELRQLAAFLRAHAALVLTAAVAFVFYAAIAQYANAGYRFQAPLYLLALVLLLRLPAPGRIRLRLDVLAAFAAVALGVSSANFAVATSRYDNVIRLAVALRGLPKGTMLVTEAGRFPFEARWTAIDSWGLNTPEFASRVISPEDVRELAPDLIVVHGFDDIRRTELRAFRESHEKSWAGQTRNILIGAGYDYALYWVPFSFVSDRPDQPPQRHDIFLIRNDSPLAEELRAVITRHGGIDTESLLRRLRISVG